MSERLIFFNVGWMKRYQGIADDDRPKGGGKFVEVNAWDHSMLNFQPFGGRCFGYAEAKSGKVNLGRLGATPGQDRLEDVTVVWVSRSPKHGSVIVGWYRKATLFREWQKPPDGSGREHQGEPIGYYATASVEDCVLLPEEARTFKIPRGKNGMGQSNVWYADKSDHEPFTASVLKYIYSYGATTQEGVRKSWIFQANPQLYDIQAALAKLAEMTWTVTAYKNHILPEDEVFIWKSGPEAGIVALATVLTAPAVMDGEAEGLDSARDRDRFSSPRLRVRLRVDRLISPPLSSEILKSDPRLVNLSILRFSQGTNFPVTLEEAKALHEILDRNTTSAVPGSVTGADGDDIPNGDAPASKGAGFRVWVYAPGPNARNWEEFYRDGIMAIGWEAIGDLSQYPDVQSTAQALIRAYNLERHPVNDSNACFEFAHVMRPGDKVIAKRGVYEVVGYGTVTGDYQHIPNRAEYPNVRSVRWERRGAWRTERALPVKVLTEFTPYTDFVKYFQRLLSPA